MKDREDLQLQIAIGTQLTLQIVGSEERIKSDLIGIRSHDYLICDIASIEILKQFRPGTIIIVRYLYFGNIYGFRSSVITSVSKPSLIVFLSFPEAIENHSLRKKERVPCNIPVKAKVLTTEVNGVILDLSAEGCKFGMKVSKNDVARLFQVDDDITIFLPFLGIEGPEDGIQAIVRHIVEDEDKRIMGLQFEKPSEAITSTIDLYVENVKEFLQ